MADQVTTISSIATDDMMAVKKPELVGHLERFGFSEDFAQRVNGLRERRLINLADNPPKLGPFESKIDMSSTRSRLRNPAGLINKIEIVNKLVIVGSDRDGYTLDPHLGMAMLFEFVTAEQKTNQLDSFEWVEIAFGLLEEAAQQLNKNTNEQNTTMYNDCKIAVDEIMRIHKRNPITTKFSQ